MKFFVPRSHIFLLLGFCFVLFSCKRNGEKDIQDKATTVDNYRQDELSVQEGMQLFNTHCASCHDFNANNIGPNLAGVTANTEKAWLIDFIRNPKQKIDTGDERAVRLYESYGTYMPAFEYFSADDLEDILGFVHKYSEAERKSKKKRPGAITNPIPVKIAQSNLQLVLEEVFQVPASAAHHPKARINKLVSLPSSYAERLFIADLNGTLYEAKGSEVNSYLNMAEELPNFINIPGFGTGFGSFDFHPNFDVNGLLYTTHTEPAYTSKADFPLPDSLKVGLQWVLTEWKAKDPLASNFNGSKRELLRVDMMGTAHGFQELSFKPMAKKEDPDYGLLYLCVGDGGAIYADQPQFVGRKDQIWGTIIRIDPMKRSSANGQYGIPSDNPFEGNGVGIPEIWAYGFRNPHRISWDTKNLRLMYVSNIGRHSVEEVNLVEKGGNYGWPYREGTFLFDSSANTEVVYPLPKDDRGYAYPIIQYDHDEGNAVSGGYVYNGKLDQLIGKYLFGDIPRGTIFIAEVDNVPNGNQASIQKMEILIHGEVTTFNTLLGGARVDLRWGMDSTGELYIFTKYDGKVYKVVDCIAKNTRST